MTKGNKYLVLNLKTYPESTGARAVGLAKMVEAILGTEKPKGIEVILAATALDLSRVAEQSKHAKVFGQHVDPIVPGKNTGFVSPENLKEAGAVGTILNHAEHQIPLEQVKVTLGRCRQAGLTTIVCVKNTEEAVEVAKLGPDFISIEFPELIGTLKSVSVLKPKFVSDAAEAVKRVSKVPVLCGAGVAGGKDVRAAIELGTDGVLLAAYFDLATDKKAALLDLLSGFQ
ncbi:MAG: triose-phosphate isomerase [archaeon]